MTSTLEAPRTMGRRSQAALLLRDLPQNLAGTRVQLVFSEDAFPTTSFLDEVIRSVIVDRGAAELVLTNANERVTEIAERSATDFGVRDRLVIEVVS